MLAWKEATDSLDTRVTHHYRELHTKIIDLHTKVAELEDNLLTRIEILETDKSLYEDAKATMEYLSSRVKEKPEPEEAWESIYQRLVAYDPAIEAVIMGSMNSYAFHLVEKIIKGMQELQKEKK